MGRPKKTPVIVPEVETKELAKSENQTADFELVTDIVVGKLTSNAKEFSAALKAELSNYTIDRYLDNPDAAKADKAYLNKLKDSVAEKRKLAVATWNKPLDEFISVMKDLEGEIDSASKELKTISDKAVQQEKDEKKAKIVEFWNTLDFKIVPLERVFNSKWLNKTEKLSSIMEEIKAIVEKINGEMLTINSMKDEDSEILKSFYLDTLDLNATLIKGNQLKENRARIKAEEERKAAEMAKRQEEAQNNLPPIDASKFNVTESGNVVKEPVQTEPPKEPVMSYRLEVTGPVSKLMALRKFIDETGLTYKKI